MKKFKLLSLSFAPLMLAPCASIVSCGNPSTTTYSITYDVVPFGMTITSKPTSINKNTKVEVKYTIANGYQIDSIDSSIFVGSNNITSSCTFTSTQLTIPADKVTDNITIKLATEPVPGKTYTVSYNNISQITWLSCPSTVKSGSNLTAEYTINDSNTYSLDWNNCSITSNSTEIKGYCTLDGGTITVPANKITGDVSITLAVKQVATYTITYTSTPTGLTWMANPPQTIKSNQNLTITYTLSKVGEDDYIIDPVNSDILIGDTSIKSNISYANGQIIIPSAYLYDNITISLATKKDTFDGSYTSSDASATFTRTTTGLVAVANKITIAPASTNGPVNVTLSGNFANSQVYIEAKGTYNITLNNFTIANTASTDTKAEIPFLINKKSAKVNLILADGSVNTINDKRSNQTEGYYNDDYDSAFLSKGEVTISGNGKLDINNLDNNQGSFNKGIKSKSLTINNQAQVSVFALDTAIQAAGSLTINNATVIADSYNSDGIKTKFDDADKDLAGEGVLNLNRDITISGAAYVQVYSARNGINAAHDFITLSDATGTPTINCCTSTTYAGSKVKTQTLDEQNMYVAIPESYNPYFDIENYFYTVTFKDSTATLNDTTEVLTLKKIKGADQPGPRSNATTYYYYKCDRPLKAYNQFVINKYTKDQFGAATMTPTATSSTCTISNGTKTSTYDTIKVSSISGSTISTESTSCNANYKQMIGQQSSIDSVVGSKGIKAKNNINITSGEIDIKSYDTCIATSYGDIYCKSTTPGDVSFGVGDITISGGTLTCESAKADGVKAYGKMNVAGGLLSVNKSIEALEAGVINISGGTTKLKASDDGMNASQVGKYYKDLVTINVSGGVLDVQTTSTNDTDAIDSNNTITITGGLIIARVPGSNPSSAFDWETGTLQMSNATFVALGTVEKTVSGGTAYTGYSGLSSSGNHTITYYTSSSTTATYTYNNATSMNSSITVRSNYSKPTFN